MRAMTRLGLIDRQEINEEQEGPESDARSRAISAKRGR